MVFKKDLFVKIGGIIAVIFSSFLVFTYSFSLTAEYFSRWSLNDFNVYLVNLFLLSFGLIAIVWVKNKVVRGILAFFLFGMLLCYAFIFVLAPLLFTTSPHLFNQISGVLLTLFILCFWLYMILIWSKKAGTLTRILFTVFIFLVLIGPWIFEFGSFFHKRLISEVVTYELSTGRKLLLAPIGKGFPKSSLDVPGNNFIPWLGWEEASSWNEANYVCKHLSPGGKKVLGIEQNYWRLPTVDETKEIIDKENYLNFSGFGIFWTDSYYGYPSKEENCVPVKDGQCVYLVRFDGKSYPSYANWFHHSWRCVRDLF